MLFLSIYYYDYKIISSERYFILIGGLSVIFQVLFSSFEGNFEWLVFRSWVLGFCIYIRSRFYGYRYVRGFSKFSVLQRLLDHGFFHPICLIFCLESFDFLLSLLREFPRPIGWLNSRLIMSVFESQAGKYGETFETLVKRKYFLN